MHNICVGIFLLCVGKTEEAVLGLAAKWQIKHLHKIELPTQASEFADPLRQVEPPHPPSPGRVSPPNFKPPPILHTSIQWLKPPTLSIRLGFGAIGTFAMGQTGNGNSNAFNDDRFG